MNGPDVSGGSLLVQAMNGKPTLKVAYLFSGVKRKAGIGNALKLLCDKAGFGLVMHEVDIGRRRSAQPHGQVHAKLDGPVRSGRV